MAALVQSSFFSMGEHTLQVPMELFALNRRRLADRLREKAPHSIVVLQGGSDAHHYCSDVDYKFQQQTESDDEEKEVGSEWPTIEKDLKPLKLQGTVLDVEEIDEIDVEEDEISNQTLELQFLNGKFEKFNPKRSASPRRRFPKRKKSKVIFETDNANSESYLLPEQLFSQTSAPETFVSSDTRSRTESSDSCSLYCQLIAEKLRSLSSRNRIIVQNKIDNLLFEALMEEMGVPTNPLKSSLCSKESDVDDCRQTKVCDLNPHLIEIKSNSASNNSNIENQVINSNSTTETPDCEPSVSICEY